MIKCFLGVQLDPKLSPFNMETETEVDRTTESRLFENK
jgi:hypothetical protein